MSQFKKHTEFRGIYVRTNDLLRQPGYLRDALNVMIKDDDSSGLRYAKRPGFSDMGLTAGARGLVRYFNDNVLLSLAITPQVYNGVTSTAVKTSETTPLLPIIGNQIADWVEINKVLYVAMEGKDLFKYDGQRFYKAGMPKSHVASSSFLGGGGTLPGGAAWRYQYTFELEYTDKQGNVVRGDFGITEILGDNPPTGVPNNSTVFANIIPVIQNQEGFAVSLQPEIDGFNVAYAEVSGRFPTAPGSFDTGSSVTINNVTSHSFEVGDRVYLQHTIQGFDPSFKPKDLNWESFEITGTTPTSITVDNPRNLAVFILPRPAGYELGTFISSVNMNVYRADNSGSGALEQAFYLESLGVHFDSSTDIRYEDDGSAPELTADPYIISEFVNIPPYQGKYIEYHKGLLFQAGATERITKTDGSFITKDQPHFVAYGSTDGFASIENFVLGGNNILVGDDSEGVVTGLKSHNDFLIIFKERSIHYISGNVITGAFRLDKVHGSEVGCLSHGSIQEVNGAVFFLAEKGVYSVVGGGSPVSVSEAIEPLFLDPNLDKSRCTSTFVFRDQRYYLYVPFTGGGGRTFVYDYEFEAWLVWDTQAENGMAFYENKLFMATGADVKTENGLLNDDGTTAINAYIVSNFEHMGEPSIPKKFINIKVFSLNNENFDLLIESFKDWVLSTVKTSTTLSFTAAQRFGKVKVLAGDNKAYSFAVRFSNNIDGEDMAITGWELEVESPYGKMKE